MSTGEFVELNKENEHILVCLSSSPSNEKIIRTAAKMARDMRARFTALYVQTGKRERESDKKMCIRDREYCLCIVQDRL